MKECPTCNRCLEDRHDLCPDDGTPLDLVFGGAGVLDGKYQLIRRLGGGGMGRVYKSRHLGLKRLVSLKILRPHDSNESHFKARFAREAEALGRLRHPNVVQVTDFGVDSDRQIPYLVMEYLDGVSLAARLRTSGALGLDTAIPLFQQIAAALDYAHASGVLHRDLKPSNVFLVNGGYGEPQVKVLDFGLARFFSDPEETPMVSPSEALAPNAKASFPSAVAAAPYPTESTTHGLLGTPGYLAPEVLDQEQPTPASDVYALGVVIFVSLVGQPPFEGTADKLANLHRHELPPQPSALQPDLGREIDAAILAPLAKDAPARPVSARAVVQGLVRAANRRKTQGWRRQEGGRRLALATVLGLVSVGLILALRSPLQGLENRLVDTRFYSVSSQPPTHPLMLVMIDDAMLASSVDPLVSMGDEMGELLAQVMESGALGVGVDLLLPESWSRSGAFSDFLLRHADSLALAAFSPLEGPVLGPEVVNGLTTAVLGPERAQDMFGFVNLDQDPDGFVRRARAGYRDVNHGYRWSFAGRVARILRSRLPSGTIPVPRRDAFWIDFAVDWPKLEMMSWRDLEMALEGEPERFRDRFVLVGMVYTGSGDGPYRVPHTRTLPEAVSGPVLQALTAHTLLDGTPVRDTPRVWTLVVAGVLAIVSAGAGLVAQRPGLGLVFLMAGMGGWIVVAQILFVYHRLLLPVSSVLVALAATGLLWALLRRRLPPFPELSKW